MMNVLIETIAYLSRHLTCNVSSEVPATRPESFVTVTRGGGPTSAYGDNAALTVQVWHVGAAALETLVDDVVAALEAMPHEVTGVYSVDIGSRSYYPEVSPKLRPRYVLSCNVYSRT